MTALAGLCSWVAAGMMRQTSESSMTRYSGGLPAEFLSLAPDDGHAVAAAFHEVLALLRALDASNRHTAPKRRSTLRYG